VAGLLLGVMRAGNIDRQRRAPSSNGATAARRSAANAGSVTFTAAVKGCTQTCSGNVLPHVVLADRGPPTYGAAGCAH